MNRMRALRAIFLTLFSVSLMLACSINESMRSLTLYDRLGGKGALVVIVHDLAARLARDPRLSTRFATTDLAKMEKRMVEQLCEVTGGGCRYTGMDMRTAHVGRGIHDLEFDAFTENLNLSLDRFRIPPKEKTELLALLTPMRKDVVH